MRLRDTASLALDALASMPRADDMDEEEAA